MLQGEKKITIEMEENGSEIISVKLNIQDGKEEITIDYTSENNREVNKLNIPFFVEISNIFPKTRMKKEEIERLIKDAKAIEGMPEDSLAYSEYSDFFGTRYWNYERRKNGVQKLYLMRVYL